MRLANIVIATILVSSTSMLFAEDAKPAGVPVAADHEQAMQEMMKLGQPNEHHEAIKSMAGTFTADTTLWMDPEDEGASAKTTGETVNQMVLDGRFLHSLYTGTAMGQPFQGVGVMGYDNQKEKYVSFWSDTMSTGFLISEGDADEAGKVFKLSAPFQCPIDDTEHAMRQVTTIVDKDHYTYEAWDVGSDGKERKMIEIKYSRK